MSRAGAGMKVALALLLLGVAVPSGATAQACTAGSKAAAIFAGSSDYSCALLVSKRPTSG